MAVETVDVAPTLTAIVRKSVAFADMPTAQRDARAALKAALAKAQLSTSGPWLTVWRPPKNGVIDYAPGVVIAGALEEAEGISLFPLPEGRAAHLCFRGPYTELASAWQVLFDGCAADGLRTAGLNWEIYAEDASPAGPRTDLFALLV